MTARADACAGTYDAALNRGLSLSGESKEYFVGGRVERLARRLAQHGHVARHVLDYGCGTGGSAPELLRRLGAASVTGVDVSGESIAVARGQHADARVQFSTVDALRRCGEYDVAYTNGVFHHIEPQCRPAALERVREALASGGFFAFCENNPWNPGTRLVMRRIAFDRDARMLSAPHARTLLRAAGFEIVSTDFLFFFPRAFGALRPLEAALSRVPAGGQYMVLCRKRA
jgi:SAM-dependent methyltransferase